MLHRRLEDGAKADERWGGGARGRTDITQFVPGSRGAWVPPELGAPSAVYQHRPGKVSAFPATPGSSYKAACGDLLLLG